MKIVLTLLTFILLVLSIFQGYAHFPDTIEQLPIGNLALPASQQPGPTFSFGQNIIDQGAMLFIEGVVQVKGCNLNFVTVFTQLLYGITDDLSLFIDLHSVPHFISDGFISTGLGDLNVQLEYAFFEKKTATSTAQSTLVTAVSLPTGSAEKNPSTGLGAPGFFLGVTFSYLSTKWYAFADDGILLTTRNKGIKFGNQFFYEFGLGHNLGNPGGCILLGLLEFNGFWTNKNRIKCIINPNSGGNMIFLGPSIFLSSERFILQAGIQFPILQQLNGIQNKAKFRTLILGAVTF